MYSQHFCIMSDVHWTVCHCDKNCNFNCPHQKGVIETCTHDNVRVTVIDVNRTKNQQGHKINKNMGKRLDPKILVGVKDINALELLL